MARRNQSTTESQVEQENDILSDEDENNEPAVPIDPVDRLNVAPATEADRKAIEDQKKQEMVERQAAANAKVAEAQSIVHDLEQSLKEAKKNLANAEVAASTVETTPGNAPVCLPQYDPTIRSARSSHEAQMMVAVVHRKPETTVELNPEK
jgi:hypothetical protein